MIKKFENFFSNYGMTINKNFAYGTINGYETNATIIMSDTAPLRMHISFYATDEQHRKIEAAINNLKPKYFNMKFTLYGMSLGFSYITVNSLLKKLPDTLNAICAILSENGALNSAFCPVCGESLNESNSKKCNIDGFTIKLDNDCVNKINNVINTENQDFRNAPNNYLKGFVGALIGGAVGAVITIIFFMIGLIASLSAFVSVALGAFLYQKFKGKPNVMMIVIVTVTTFVCLCATVLGLYMVVALGLSIEADPSIQITAMEAFKIWMQNAEFARGFYGNLATVLAFSALGAGYEIYALNKKIKRQKNI